MSPDGEFGVLKPNGKWTGMVGELTTGDADLVTLTLDNTNARAQVVSFLVPIDHTG